MRRIKKRKKTIPEPRLLGNGSAGVNFAGTRITLGPWDHEQHCPSPLASLTYAHLLAAWEAKGRKPLPGEAIEAIRERARAELNGGSSRKREPSKTVGDLIDEYVRLKSEDQRHAVTPSTQRTIRHHLIWFQERYGAMPAETFGIAHLEESQQILIAQQRCNYRTINLRIRTLIAAYKRGVQLGWVEPTQIVALTAITHLSVRSKGVKPRYVASRKWNGVPDDIFEATLKHVQLPMVRDMLRLLRLTGMRCGELCAMTLSEVDMSGDVWVYMPTEHKTAHKGKERPIVLGPRAQTILQQYMHTDLKRPLFSPREAMEAFWAERRANRKWHPSTNKARDARFREEPKHRLGKQWSSAAIGRAVTRACERAKVDHWSPHRLRHAYINDIRREFGEEVAQKLVGHASAEMTRQYGDADLRAMAEAARKVG
ncbi:MAG: site-specific integrase [Phycisphaerales bacterium]|nr:site-specific integrase [Phycisphaerales bacterium]